jgi:uncharacterized protein (DUF1778 family)
MHYITHMKAKSTTLQIRLSPAEKDGFEQAASVAGLAISAWVRERLRDAAIRELERVGRPAPFVTGVPLEDD